jgi:hypothetical protein
MLQHFYKYKWRKFGIGEMGEAGVYYCHTNGELPLDPSDCEKQLREVWRDPVAVVRIEEITPISMEEYESHTGKIFSPPDLIPGPALLN